MNICGIDIKNPTALAPLAGWSDPPFRRLCRTFGAGLLCTEMISADGTIRHQAKTLALAEFFQSEGPVSVQLFGAEPDIIADAVQIIAEKQPDFIDLNFGCPAKKIIKRGAGSALLRDLPRLTAIARAAVSATSIPVTAKIRSGWDHQSIIAVEAARRLQDTGIAAIALHPRTQTMGFTGHSDWNLIAKVKQAVQIPVFGNGDIHTGQDARDMFDQTGCDMVMIGRAAMGNPWIFPQIHTALNAHTIPEHPSFAERLDICLQHLDYAVDWYGADRAILKMRKQLSQYLKGLPDSSKTRRQLFNTTELDDVKRILIEMKKQLQQDTEIKYVNKNSLNEPDDTNPTKWRSYETQARCHYGSSRT
ncbi:MAG: tRNA dihydrouridine synthase DusB [candidate division KSB1 bacterium]|nr:tRNA dihydrouridine synthase DusB [candidate division KSB1 bacterium]